MKIIPTFLLMVSYILFFNGNVDAWQYDNDSLEINDSSKTVNIKIEEGSYLLINGNTNVNEFQCRYDELISDGETEMTVLYDNGCLYFKNTHLTLPTNNFYCENQMMTEDFQELMQSEVYPNISINVECIVTDTDNKVKTIPVKSSASGTNTQTASVHASFKITDEVNEYKVPVSIQQDKNKRIYTGTLMINIRDFGIEPPKKMLGMVKVDKWIEIHLYLIIALADNS